MKTTRVMIERDPFTPEVSYAAPYVPTELVEALANAMRLLGEPPTRGGIIETPFRWAKALREMTAGYEQDPLQVLKVFEDGAEGTDQMVLVRDIPFYSLCEHHLAPFFGTISIGYVPCGKIVGLSKLARLADVFARRLQVQERLTNEIADSLVEGLDPRGVGVLVKARHLCMESRGIRRPGAETVTSALRGVMLDENEARAEFMSLAAPTRGG